MGGGFVARIGALEYPQSSRSYLPRGSTRTPQSLYRPEAACHRRTRAWPVWITLGRAAFWLVVIAVFVSYLRWQWGHVQAADRLFEREAREAGKHALIGRETPADIQLASVPSEYSRQAGLGFWGFLFGATETYWKSCHLRFPPLTAPDFGEYCRSVSAVKEKTVDQLYDDLRKAASNPDPANNEARRIYWSIKRKFGRPMPKEAWGREILAWPAFKDKFTAVGNTVYPACGDDERLVKDFADKDPQTVLALRLRGSQTFYVAGVLERRHFGAFDIFRRRVGDWSVKTLGVAEKPQGVALDRVTASSFFEERMPLPPPRPLFDWEVR